jgi:SmpA / OmlA family
MKILHALTVGTIVCLIGCASPIAQPVEGYLCCNARARDGWISSTDVRGGSFLPFGEPIKVTSIKRRYYAYGQVGNSNYGFRDDSARSEEETIAWLKKIVVKEDPRKIFDTWPVDVRAAVSSSKVFTGMTRTQVLMSLGHPSPTLTKSLDSSTWTYLTEFDHHPVELIFDQNNSLVELKSDSLTGLRTIEVKK